MTQETSPEASEVPIPFATFLEAVPPGRSVAVVDLVRPDPQYPGYSRFQLRLPQIQLHCDSPTCDGVRHFLPRANVIVEREKTSREFVSYYCRNCGVTPKIFALEAVPDSDGTTGAVMKYGENPPFGPPSPSRFLKLVGEDQEIFLKGRRSESQGLGIAAFAYYRRVVENQKNRIFDEILRVSKKLGASPDLIQDLEAAKLETRFSTSVDKVKHGLPQVLLINAHNPLTLLHGALSDGLHAQSDAECLELARSIRIVMFELTDRMVQAMKEEAELGAALSKLLQVTSQKSKKE
jgi:hypothetical protein